MSNDMMKKRTKIVCTIGPASDTPEIIRDMILAGMNVCRLNFSHGSHEEHAERIRTIKRVRAEMDEFVAILLDTKGPEIRTGRFEGGQAMLKQGEKFTLTVREDVVGNENICSISYKGLIDDIKPGDMVLMDDGLISMVVQEISGEDITCIIENPGIIKDRKGVAVPNIKVNLPAISEQDRKDLMFGIEHDVDFIAASFIRKASDVLEIRELLNKNGGENIHIISKIENQEGVDNLDEIIGVSDGVMVARGDLGVEIPMGEIAIVQKEMIRKVRSNSKPVITATQMLDSMMRNPRPTRAEVTDVANAIFDGSDAIMLSGETAAGKYPVEAVKTMTDIALRTESAKNIDEFRDLLFSVNKHSVTHAISNATCSTARDLNAKAIITTTASGRTTRMVSVYRPHCPIIASTYTESVARRCSILWGVYPLLTEKQETTDMEFEQSVNAAMQKGMIDYGDLVVITAGVPIGISGTTNLIKVHVTQKND